MTRPDFLLLTHDYRCRQNAVGLGEMSVRPELVEGFHISSWWFDRLTPKGCENLCEATNGKTDNIGSRYAFPAQ